MAFFKIEKNIKKSASSRQKLDKTSNFWAPVVQISRQRGRDYKLRAERIAFFPDICAASLTADRGTRWILLLSSTASGSSLKGSAFQAFDSFSEHGRH